MAPSKEQVDAALRLNKLITQFSKGLLNNEQEDVLLVCLYVLESAILRDDYPNAGPPVANPVEFGV